MNPNFASCEPEAEQQLGYTVVKQLGSGSFGTTFAARQGNEAKQPIAETVVLKCIPKGPETKEMVRNEAAILNHLRSNCEGYLLCYQGFQQTDHNYYIITQFLDRYRTLEEVMLQYRDVMSEQDYAALFCAMIRALAVAHELGVSHNDLKPANILVKPPSANNPEWDVRLIDFGIASMGDDYARVHDPASGTAGTPIFQAPEWLLSRQIDPVTPPQVVTLADEQQGDIWGLGATMWWTVFGREPLTQLFPSEEDDEDEDQSEDGQETWINRLKTAAEALFYASRVQGLDSAVAVLPVQTRAALVQRFGSPLIARVLDAMLKTEPDDRRLPFDLLQCDPPITTTQQQQQSEGVDETEY